jgi:hypothetical protein
MQLNRHLTPLSLRRRSQVNDSDGAPGRHFCSEMSRGHQGVLRDCHSESDTILLVDHFPSSTVYLHRPFHEDGYDPLTMSKRRIDASALF